MAQATVTHTVNHVPVIPKYLGFAIVFSDILLSRKRSAERKGGEDDSGDTSQRGGKSDVYIQDPQHLDRSPTGQMIFDPFVQ